ncbi:phage tail tape measure protein [Acinetobacter sp. ANC 4216]|uniref:tape measure protein n=1 Tax=Acinetobacter sp. ANC 4216 TaxID=2529840 RepID=UPI00103F062C|nr:tape measure protein [Acinetobacter sp. ANC 4216]TCB67390.1 phage tail tape measure protein [Acinetobacter sp. ANC 4216]
MAGKNLTFKLVMDADTKAFVTNMNQSEKAAKDALNAIKEGSANIVGDTSKATKEIDNLGTQAQETATEINKLDQELAEINKELQQTESFTQRASGEIQGLKTGFTALTSALAALGIGTSAMEIAQTADEYKNLSGRLTIAIGAHGDLKKAMDDVRNVAIATNSNLTATGDLYARLTKIGQEMKWPQEQALALTETINKAIQVGGGSAASNEAAITQLNQALGSGVLRGDEFNSMIEQSPRLTQAMADGLGVTIGKLREMAEAGKLTTDVVTKALLSQSEKISAEFAKFPATIGASIENLKTAWTTYIGEADAASGASTKVAEALKYVADNLDSIVSTLTLAAQAFIAYKALNIANVFLDKAAGVRAASVAITQETAVVVANTQAQLANATATRAAAVAKTQLATNSAAAATASSAASGSVMAMVGRLGALGVAVTAIGVLVPTVFQPIGTWLGEAAAKTEDYVFNNGELAKSLETLKQQELASEARAKALADSKKLIAEAAEKSRDKAYQLTEQSKKLVTEFNELIKKGEPTKDALEKISQAMKFDSTKSINDSVTALILLKDQGKITGDQLQQSLGKALDGKDLVVFETNARAAFAGTSKEAEKNAQLTEAVMKAALERTGLSTEQLQGKFSLAFQSANNDVQTVVNNLDAYKAKGIDTGLALSANLNKAIDTAQTRAELDYAKAKLIELEKQGLITGEQVALGLGLIEKKAQQLPDALNPAIAAFNALGIKTKDQLNEAADVAKRNFDVVSKSGRATADGIKQAYTQMLNAAIASGDQARIAAVQAKAASHGLTVEISDTGKAVVQTTSEWVKANANVENSARGIGDGYRHAGQIAREEAKSSTEAWRDAVAAASKQFDAEMKRQGEALSKGIYNYSSYSKADVLSQLKSKGYSDKEAEKLAGSIWSKAMEADRAAKERGLGGDGSLAMKALINAEFDRAAAKGLTTQNGTNKINELLSQITLSSLAPSISTPTTNIPSTDASKNVNYNINFGGQTLSLSGSVEQESVMNQLINQLKIQAKST